MIANLYTKYKGNRSAITVLNYVQDLSLTSGIPIKGIDIEALFFKDGQAEITSPRDINKIFFAMKDSKTPGLSALVLTSDQLVLLAEMETDIKQNVIETRNAQERNITESIRSKQSEIERFGQQLGDLRRITMEQINFVQVVNDLTRAGFFRFMGTGRDGNNYLCLEFITQPVMLRPFADKPETVCQMGRYHVRLIPKRFYAIVKAFDQSRFASQEIDGAFLPEKNRYFNGHYHPFIGNSGAICWGSASEVATQAISSGGFLNYMNLLHALLTSYPGGHPYVAMDRFFAEAKDWLGNPYDENCTPIPAPRPSVFRRRQPHCEYCDEGYSEDEDDDNYAIHGVGECHNLCESCEAQISTDQDICDSCHERQEEEAAEEARAEQAERDRAEAEEESAREAARQAEATPITNEEGPQF